MEAPSISAFVRDDEKFLSVFNLRPYEDSFESNSCCETKNNNL